ncbi:MAG: cupredoxin domain-containing protein, partial [Dehalococcoidia bacterium]
GLAVRFGDHPDQGSNAQLFTIVTAAVVVVAAASSRAPAAVKRFEPAFHGLAVVAALGAAGMVTLAGHSGATLVYKDVGTLVLLPPTPVPAATPAAQAGATPTPSAAAPIQIAVTLAEFSFTPSELRVKTGAAVTVLATNSGIRTHTLSIPAIQANTGDMGAGTTVNLSFTAPAPGRYDFLCTIGSHAESGMVGVLIVDP